MLTTCGSRIELCTGSERADLKDLVSQRIAAAKPQVLSFDVFDTVLLRNNKPEAARYYELSQILSKVFADQNGSGVVPSTEDLYLARYMGMELSYRTRPAKHGCREGSIDDVIKTQVSMLGLSSSDHKTILDQEIAYEIDNLTPNTVLIDLAEEFRASGGTVILLSDMYLGAKIIGDILSGLGCDDFYDHLVSSADRIISKRSGRLFKEMEKELGVKSRQCLHMGDSFEGDVSQPLNAGWLAVHFPVSSAELRARQAALDVHLAAMAAQSIDMRKLAKI